MYVSVCISFNDAKDEGCQEMAGPRFLHQVEDIFSINDRHHRIVPEVCRFGNYLFR